MPSAGMNIWANFLHMVCLESCAIKAPAQSQGLTGLFDLNFSHGHQEPCADYFPKSSFLLFHPAYLFPKYPSLHGMSFPVSRNSSNSFDTPGTFLPAFM